MSKKVFVVAAGLSDPGLKGKHRVTKERQPGRYIDELTPTEVELTPYYHRMVHLRGELRIVEGKEKESLLQAMKDNPPPKPVAVERDEWGDPKSPKKGK